MGEPGSSFPGGLHPEAIWTVGFLAAGIPCLAWLVLRILRGRNPVPEGTAAAEPRGVLLAAGIVAGSLLGTVLLAIVLAFGFAGLVGGSDPNRWGYHVLLLVDVAAKVSVLALALLLAARRIPPAKPGIPAPAAPALRVGLVAGLAAAPVMAAVSWVQVAVYGLFGREFRGQDVVRAAEEGGTGLFLLVAAFAVVVAPLFEEVLFRRFLYGGLRERLGPATTILGTSVLFSIWHIEPDAMPVTFVLGLGLGALRERTGGLLAPLAMHACYNAVQVAGIWARRGGA